MLQPVQLYATGDSRTQLTAPHLGIQLIYVCNVIKQKPTAFMSAVSTSQQWYNDVSSVEFGAWCKRIPQVKAAGQTRRKISFRSSAHIQMDIDQISFRRRAHIQMYMDRISFRLIAHIQMHMDQISFRRRAHMWMEKYPSPPLFPIPPPPRPPQMLRLQLFGKTEREIKVCWYWTTARKCLW